MKKKVFRIIQISLLIFIFYWFFGRNIPTIVQALSGLSFKFIIFLLAFGMLYFIFEGLAYCLTFKGRRELNPLEGINLSLLGMFGNVVSAGLGNLPLQTYYLYKRNIDAGTAAGTFLFNFILHKISIILLGIMMLIVSYANRLDLYAYHLYLLYGFIAEIAITLFLIALSLSKYLNTCLHHLCDRLPAKFDAQKKAIHENLDLLKNDVKIHFTHEKSSAYGALFFHFLKFFSLCLLSYFVSEALHYDIDFIIVIAYVGFIQVIAGALPNISGMGPIEFSYNLFFQTLLSSAQISSFLLVYRIGNYFFPFLMSLLVVPTVKKEPIK